MIHLILSILFSTSLFVIFKYFKVFKINTLQAIVVNYFVVPGQGFSKWADHDIIHDFDFASSTVHEDQRPVYDEIVEKYHHRKTPIIIIGETDGFGSKDYNTALAHHRSSIIIKELKDRGIKDSEIELRLKVRCCKSQAVTREALMATQNDRITWVHFD